MVHVNKFLLIVGTCLILGCRPAKTLDSVAKDYELAFKNKDARTLASLASPVDLRVSGLAPKSFEDLLQNEIFKQWQSSGPASIESNLSAGELMLRIPTKNSAGQEFTWFVQIVNGDNGIYVQNAPITPALFVASAKIASAGNNPLGIIKIAGWKQFADTTGPEWEKKYGMKGYVPGKESGCVTWAQLSENYAEKIRRYEQDTGEKVILNK